ncbi:unnamed protein product [Blepharisma stoltei]|uniref:Protein kinase domain-containing protein n=1 Tax=Blepharisma stoltei TaxID=1481888 RepID=A0AAU9JYJ9_9CILI|nr:unnamed protein product [Blepharisma stoltei]
MDLNFSSPKKFNGISLEDSGDLVVFKDIENTPKTKMNDRYTKTVENSPLKDAYIKPKKLEIDIKHNIENYNTQPTHRKYMSRIPLSPANECISLKKTLFKKIEPPSMLTQRASSVSPSRTIGRRTFLTEEKNPIFPLNSEQFLKEFANGISEAEKREIIGYGTVYYFNAKYSKSKYNPIAREDFDVIIGDHVKYRYEILEYLGSGTFGRVLKCFDHKLDEPVAIKIMKKNPKHQKQGESEAKFLEILQRADPEDSKNIIRMKERFMFRGYFCIVTELFSINLYQFLRKNSFQGVSMTLLKRIAIQLLIALKHIHSQGLIHCDIKPENVLLKQEGKSSIKIIDFGNACEKNLVFHTYVQSRIYRSPEVVLGRKYNCKIDIWSLGCMLVELYQGTPLFPCENEQDLLRRIVIAIGLPSVSFLRSCSRKNIYFTPDYKLIRVKENKRSYCPSPRTLLQILEGADSDFSSFIERCLTWDPQDRITAEEALSHQWINPNKEQITPLRKTRSRFFSETHKF